MIPLWLIWSGLLLTAVVFSRTGALLSNETPNPQVHETSTRASFWSTTLNYVNKRIFNQCMRRGRGQRVSPLAVQLVVRRYRPHKHMWCDSALRRVGHFPAGKEREIPGPRHAAGGSKSPRCRELSLGCLALGLESMFPSKESTYKPGSMAPSQVLALGGYLDTYAGTPIWEVEVAAFEIG